MKVHIAIDTKTFVRFWLVVFGFAFAILAIYSARQALFVIGAAFFLAIALNTPVSFLARHLPGRSRVAGTALSYIVVVALLAAFIVFVIPPIIQQTIKFTSTLPSIVDTATKQWHVVNDFVTKYHLQGQLNEAIQSFKTDATNWLGHIAPNLVSGLGSIVNIITSTLLILVMTFLMLIEGPMWMKRIWDLYENEDRMQTHKKLATKMYDVVNGYVTGQLTISALDGVTAAIAIYILSLFFPIPLNLALPTAAVMFTLSLIPMFGATLGGVVIFALVAFNSLAAGIYFAIYFLVYQQIENNFISPTIQSRKLDLSPLVVLIAVAIGLYLFGLLGGIISIPIAGCIKVLIEHYLTKARKERKESSRPLAKLVRKIHNEV